MAETMDNGSASETIEVKAGEIMFSIGQGETPKKNKSVKTINIKRHGQNVKLMERRKKGKSVKTINMNGKPVEITKLPNGKCSFKGEDVDKLNILATPDSVKCDDKVNVFSGNIESMTIIPGNSTTPTSITYKATSEEPNEGHIMDKYVYLWDKRPGLTYNEWLTEQMEKKKELEGIMELPLDP